MKRLFINMLFPIAMLLLGIIASVITMTVSSEIPTWIVVVVGVLVGVIIVLTFGISKIYSQGRSYNVAILGFPKSGKTTLIISLFREYFAGKISNLKMTIRGSKTIERINEYTELLEEGVAIGPTKDQDRFSFRADIQVGQGFFIKNYIVEFGDFPGDDSENYIKKYGPWLHNTEFFKWVMDADALVFVIDIGRYVSDKRTYVIMINGALRASWQHLTDVSNHQSYQVKRRPVIIAFTKSDLLQVEAVNYKNKNLKNKIRKLGFGNHTPQDFEFNTKILDNSEEKVLNDFNEIIQYFSNEVTNFKVIFCSSFGLVNGNRLGISNILTSVIPK